MSQNNKTQTSTQIRNFYSDEMSYLNIKFYNTNLSFQFYPFTGKDQNGRSMYDTNNGETTTVNFEGAYTLWQAAKDIIDGKVTETDLPIPCASGAELKLERNMGQNGQYETIFSISKNNRTIPFKFNIMLQQVKENNQIVTKVIESGLGAVMKTIEGYLTGINSDRHLDKLTEDFAKLQESRNNNNNGYNGQNNYKKPANNNNYRKNYNNNNNGTTWQPAQPSQQQNFSTYKLPN